MSVEKTHTRKTRACNCKQINWLRKSLCGTDSHQQQKNNKATRD